MGGEPGSEVRKCGVSSSQNYPRMQEGGMLCGGCVFVITYTYMYKCRPAVSWRCGSLIVHALYVDYQISNWEMAHSTHDWFTYLISLLC